MSSLTALLPIRGIYLQMTLLELFMNGLYTGVFIATIYSFVFRKGAERISLPICMAFVAMYTFSTVHAASRWVMIKNAFIDNGDTPESTLAYLLENPVWLVIIPGIAFPANTLVADCVLIWRCWTVWNQNLKVIIIPTLCTIVGAAFGFLSVAKEVQFILHPNLDRNAFRTFATVWFIMSLATTLVATLFIVFRILTMTEGRLRGYGRVIEIVVESAALYCVVLIIFLPFLIRGSTEDGYPEAILVQVTGLAPTLIIARVSFGLARPDTTWKGYSGLSILSRSYIPSGARIELSSHILPSALVLESQEFKNVVV
ncbi:hypothetical protein B0H17DRAFT_1197677 [Mycena rosella]|uniref:Uncharacterized protein n=1 Tax=Mycena rosella TaxID=1033263 RepID=A0AAD7DQF2_MYCRO|nr:hypothetical protein B0H17DRAFT_1197677 [Mycena rosella]